jgi:hypothetical protein
MPYYRIVFPTQGGEGIFGAYYGDNHAAFETFKSPNKTWSLASLTYEDVQQLLGQIRGFKGKKK